MNTNPKIQRDWFANDQSFAAFCYAVDRCRKLKSLETEGYIFIDEEGRINKDWEIRIEGTESCVLLDRVFFAGGQWSKNPKTGEYDLIWCTKGEVDKFLRSIKCIPPRKFKTALSYSK